MSLFVDTSVVPRPAKRRPPDRPECARLGRTLESGEAVYLTGLVFQEIPQGVRGPKWRNRIQASRGIAGTPPSRSRLPADRGHSADTMASNPSGSAP